jgi:hypothetical protein
MDAVIGDVQTELRHRLSVPVCRDRDAGVVLGFKRRRFGTSRIVDEPTPRALAGLWAATAPVLAWGEARKARIGAAVAGYSVILATMVATASRLGAPMFVLNDPRNGSRRW